VILISWTCGMFSPFAPISLIALTTGAPGLEAFGSTDPEPIGAPWCRERGVALAAAALAEPWGSQVAGPSRRGQHGNVSDGRAGVASPTLIDDLPRPLSPCVR
jgi:hypothetical protein